MVLLTATASQHFSCDLDGGSWWLPCHDALWEEHHPNVHCRCGNNCVRPFLPSQIVDNWPPVAGACSQVRSHEKCLAAQCPYSPGSLPHHTTPHHTTPLTILDQHVRSYSLLYGNLDLRGGYWQRGNTQSITNMHISFALYIYYHHFTQTPRLDISKV